MQYLHVKPSIAQSINRYFQGYRANHDYLTAAVQRQEPTEEDARKRTDVLYQVNQLVKGGLRGWHGMHVAPYGSFVSGLYTSTGDLDISIEGNRIL